MKDTIMNKKNISLFISISLLLNLCLFNIQCKPVQNKGIEVTDFSGIYHANINCIEYPKSISQLRDIVINADKPIAVAGGKYSMGGHTWCKDGIVINTKHLHAITSFDPDQKIITVQAGACWRDVQEFLHKHNLSIIVMQSYNDFSIGGSLSVNCHGRDPHGQHERVAHVPEHAELHEHDDRRIQPDP